MTEPIERVQTGVRLEKRLVKVLNGLAEQLDMPLSSLLEGMVLHCFEGKRHSRRPPWPRSSSSGPSMT